MSLAPEWFRKREDLLGFGVALFLALATVKVLTQIHGPHFDVLADTWHGVVVGRPQWIAYQNRLLGPWLVNLIAMLGVSNVVALKLFITATTAAQGLLLYGLLRRFGDPARAAMQRVALFFLAVLLTQHYWFYTWDNIELLLLSLFAFGVIERRGTLFFTLLFAVALLNRESALFIALYLCIDAFRVRPALVLENPRKLLTGAALLLGGGLWTHFIRRALFVAQPDGATDAAHAAIGNHINLMLNLGDLLYRNLFSQKVLYTAFLLAVLIYVLRLWSGLTDAGRKLALIVLVMFANILVFGLINETRMYLILFPLLLVLSLDDRRVRVDGRD